MTMNNNNNNNNINNNNKKKYIENITQHSLKRHYQINFMCFI